MRPFFSRGFRRTTLLAVWSAAALIGIGLAGWTALPWPGLMPLWLPVIMLWKRRNGLTLLAVVIAGLGTGCVRGSVSMHALTSYNDAYNRTVTIVGTAAGDGVYGRQSQLAFDLSSAHLTSAVGGSSSDVPLAGTIGISGFGENAVFRGDVIAVRGKLKAGSGSHQAWMSYAQLQIIDHDSSLLNKIRRRFSARMMSVLPEPLGSFGMGLLIGGHTTLPDTVYQDLLMVGLVHIIAVSGYNLTIILRASMRLFGKRSKYQTTIFSVALILSFLLLTGASASIVRASIVSLLSLAAWYYGRAFKPVLLILAAAAGTALVNPLYIRGDMGWYLSFLAFYGVMVVGPLVNDRFVSKRYQASLLVGMAVESMCAEAMTLPLVLHVFGQMSLVSLPANLLIAVAVPLAMLLSLAAGLAGLFLWPVAGWLAWPAMMILTYMLDAAHLLASIPHIFLQNLGFSVAGLCITYAVVAALNLILYSHTKRNRAIITSESRDMPLPFQTDLLQRNFFEENRAIV